MTIQQAYQKYNQLYWRGRLPKNVAVKWSGEVKRLYRLKPHILACLHPHGYAECEWKGCDRPYIILNERFEDCTGLIEFNLLHEMCHARGFIDGDTCYFSHGRKWQAEMKRIAARGAFRLLW